MKIQKSLRLFVVIGLVLAIVATSFVAACPAPTTPTTTPPTTTPPTTAAPPTTTPTKPIQLDLVLFLPTSLPLMQSYLELFADEVNKQSGGELIINCVGGPEVIGGMDQAAAVQAGVIDMAEVPTAFYEGLVPVGNTLMLSQFTPAEERARGAWDYLNEVHHQYGLHFLARGEPSHGPVFWAVSTSPVEKLADFKGLRAGAISVYYMAFSEALGMSFSLITEWGEAYSAVERGVIDVYSQTPETCADMGLEDAVSYAISHPFYRTNAVTIINLDTWNSIPKHLQDLMLDVFIQSFEKTEMDAWEIRDAASRQKFVDAGVKIVEFSPDEAETYLETAYRVERERLEAQYPDTAPQILELIMK